MTPTHTPSRSKQARTGAVLLGILAASLLALGAASGSARPDGTPPAVSGLQPIRVEPQALDLGFLRPGQSASGSVEITNTSEAPVTIAAIQPTCSCTTTNDLAGRVIPPGASVSFDATLAAGEVPGPKRATIKVVAEGTPRPLDIEVRAEVSDAVRAVPNAVQPPPVGPAEGRIVVESLDRKPFTVLSSDRRPPRFAGFDPRRAHPDSIYVLRTDLGAMPAERRPALWLIETDRADCPVLAVRVRDERLVVPAVLRLPEYVLAIGALRPGETREIALLSNEPLEGAVEVKGGGPCMLRAIGCEAAGERWKLRLQVTAGAEAVGAFLDEVQVQVGDRVQRLPAYGTVRGEPVVDAGPAARR